MNASAPGYFFRNSDNKTVGLVIILQTKRHSEHRSGWNSIFPGDLTSLWCLRSHNNHIYIYLSFQKVNIQTHHTHIVYLFLFKLMPSLWHHLIDPSGGRSDDITLRIQQSLDFLRKSRWDRRCCWFVCVYTYTIWVRWVYSFRWAALNHIP